ncbi:hypothetical protein DFH11DRAFT_150596 [Phellopilus nigrolimitatus]|nr:hypothetical protein DFH11DRAFT_150596 [Phellopilus nigrolimitatus]
MGGVWMNSSGQLRSCSVFDVLISASFSRRRPLNLEKCSSERRRRSVDSGPSSKTLWYACEQCGLQILLDRGFPLRCKQDLLTQINGIVTSITEHPGYFGPTFVVLSTFLFVLVAWRSPIRIFACPKNVLDQHMMKMLSEQDLRRPFLLWFAEVHIQFPFLA